MLYNRFLLYVALLTALLLISTPAFSWDNKFEKEDLLSLHLRTAFIADFPENTLTPWITEMFTRGWGDPIGEIAIVANAFEEVDKIVESYT